MSPGILCALALAAAPDAPLRDGLTGEPFKLDQTPLRRVEEVEGCRLRTQDAGREQVPEILPEGCWMDAPTCVGVGQELHACRAAPQNNAPVEGQSSTGAVLAGFLLGLLVAGAAVLALR